MDIELSIIIPIYNVEKYLKECLESVYKIKNISKEIILVNDKSMDNSYKIIEEYKEKYPLETIIINHDINKGLSEARNSGLKIAKGEYVSFIDSDDIVLSEKYEEIFSSNKEYNLDIILGNGKYYKKNEIKERFIRNEEIEHLGIVSGKTLLENMLKLNSYHEMVWLNFYKRYFLIKNNISFYKNLLHEDALFIFLALLKASKVKYVNVDFYLYRQREGSIMSNISLKNEKHRLFICEKLCFIAKEEKVKSCYIFKYILSLYWGVFFRSKLQNKNLLYKILFLKTKSSKSFIKKIILLMYFPFSIKIKNLDIDIK